MVRGDLSGGLFLLHGPVGSGKTSLLAHWVADRADAAGVLQPRRAAGRAYLDLRTGEEVPLEPVADGEPALTVGRFRFRATAFVWANARVAAAGQAPVLILDEIGPLELAGAGLRPALDIALARRAGITLLVVRETLLPDLQALAPQAVALPCAAWPHWAHTSTSVP